MSSLDGHITSAPQATICLDASALCHLLMQSPWPGLLQRAAGWTRTSDNPSTSRRWSQASDFPQRPDAFVRQRGEDDSPAGVRGCNLMALGSRRKERNTTSGTSRITYKEERTPFGEEHPSSRRDASVAGVVLGQVLPRNINDRPRSVGSTSGVWAERGERNETRVTQHPSLPRGNLGIFTRTRACISKRLSSRAACPRKRGAELRFAWTSNSEKPSAGTAVGACLDQ